MTKDYWLQWKFVAYQFKAISSIFKRKWAKASQTKFFTLENYVKNSPINQDTHLI